MFVSIVKVRIGGGGGAPTPGEYVTRQEFDEAINARPTMVTVASSEPVPEFPYVEYVQQTLTDEQKAQVRANIGIE